MSMHDDRLATEAAYYAAKQAALVRNASFLELHELEVQYFPWANVAQRSDLRTQAEIDDLPESRGLVAAHRELIEVLDVQHPSPGLVREAREELKRARIARDAALRRYWHLDMDAAPVIA